MEKNNNASVRFAAIDPVVESNIISPKESRLRGRDYVSWGDGNLYPQYLQSLYDRCGTLRTIINGCTDFATGDDVVAKVSPQGDGKFNKRGDTARELVRLCANDWYQYFGFALLVIRNYEGGIAGVEWIDLRHLRTNDECDVFYYSEDYGERNVRSDRVIIYPAFMEGSNAPASVLYVKGNRKGVYPAPLYAAVIKEAETEAAIGTYHLNDICNGFVSNLFVNFNNGQPQDEEKEEIERDFNEKFTGAENAGRVGFSWNEDKDHATSFDTIQVADFGARYEALSRHCRQQLFTAFRANPNLFGIPTENLGFSSEEYDSAFRLFNRTQVIPVQRTIVDAFDRILGMKDSIDIVPFSI